MITVLASKLCINHQGTTSHFNILSNSIFMTKNIHVGTDNPNKYETMYWKDTDNILQDLSKFSALYVRVHQCAWTWNQRHNDEDEEVEENDYWYLGKIPSMQANVAFSLYGQLNGQGTFPGCNSLTFINSFYTTTGYTAFSKALYYAGASGFSSSSTGVSYGAECQNGYGVGCDSSGGFAVHQYSSSVCNPANVTKTTNTLSNLNSAMKNVQCTQIYSKSKTYGSYSSSSSSSNNDDGSDDGYSSRSTTSLSLLDNSAACFYQNVYSPDGTCPDPFGKIAYYKSTFYKEIQKAKAQRPTNIYRKEAQYTADISHGQSNSTKGIILVALAGIVLLLDMMVVKYVLPKFTTKGKAAASRVAIKDEMNQKEQHSMTESGNEEDLEYM